VGTTRNDAGYRKRIRKKKNEGQKQEKRNYKSHENRNRREKSFQV